MGEVLSMLSAIGLGTPSTIVQKEGLFHVTYPPTFEIEEFYRTVESHNLRSRETKTSPYTVIHDVLRKDILHLQMFYVFIR